MAATRQQVKVFMSQREKGNTQAAAAAKAGISERTGRRIEREDGKPESKGRHRRTRNDPFAGVWDEVAEKLGSNPELLPLNQVVFRANSPTNSAEEPIFAIKGRIVSLTALLLLAQALARKSPQGKCLAEILLRNAKQSAILGLHPVEPFDRQNASILKVQNLAFGSIQAKLAAQGKAEMFIFNAASHIEPIGEFAQLRLEDMCCWCGTLWQAPSIVP